MKYWIKNLKLEVIWSKFEVLEGRGNETINCKQITSYNDIKIKIGDENVNCDCIIVEYYSIYELNGIIIKGNGKLLNL